MPSCPNCGQETSGDSCLWCGYPIMKGDPVTRKGAKKEAEKAKEQTKMETKEAKKSQKAEALAKKKAEQQTKERAKREAKREAEEAKKAEALAKKEAEQQTEERAKETGAELYQGIVKLTILPPVDSGQVSKLEEHLSQVTDLRLILVGGSATEGTEIVVSAENPIPLMEILKEMPPVAQVTKKGKATQITLKAE